jgi:hypothetical protein
MPRGMILLIFWDIKKHLEKSGAEAHESKTGSGTNLT